MVEPYIVCNECGPGLSGQYNLCTKLGFIGLAGGGGGLSGKVVVDTRWVHPVGDIPLDEAALIEPLAVAYHAVGRSDVKAGDVAVVGGAGPIGLLTAAVLKGLGVTTIVTISAPDASSARTICISTACSRSIPSSPAVA